MMNTILFRRILLTAIGAGFGLATGTIIARRLYPEYEDVTEENAWIPEDEMEQDLQQEEEQDIKIPEISKKSGNQKSKNNKIDYSSLTKKEDLNDVVKKYLPGGEEKKDQPSMEMISQEKYREEGKPYYNMVVTYYAGDDVFIDNAGDVIADPRILFGQEAVLKVRKSSEEETVYIRNYLTMTDYLVSRLSESSGEEAADEKPQKPKAKPSRRTRKVQDLEDDED